MAGVSEDISDPLAELAREPSAPPYRWLRAAGWGVARMFSILALAVAWEVAARSGAFTPYMLPALSAVLERIWSDLITGDLLINTGVTLYRALTGFLIGAVAGIALGMGICRNRLANWFFDPIISVGFPMPKITFLAVVMLWLGVYDMSKITMISVEAIFPVVTATIIGIRGVERELLWSARNMGAGERELLWQIALPAALPQIITGLQVALPTALIVEIVAEMMMGGDGLGAAMLEASRQLNSPDVFAGIIEVMAIGWGVVTTMAWLRRRLLVWHQEDAQPATTLKQNTEEGPSE